MLIKILVFKRQGFVVRGFTGLSSSWPSLSRSLSLSTGILTGSLFVIKVVLCISITQPLSHNTLALPNYDNKMSTDTGKLITRLKRLLKARVAKILGHRHKEGKTYHHPIPSCFPSVPAFHFPSNVGAQLLKSKDDITFNMAPPLSA